MKFYMGKAHNPVMQHRLWIVQLGSVLLCVAQYKVVYWNFTQGWGGSGGHIMIGIIACFVQ